MSIMGGVDWLQSGEGATNVIVDTVGLSGTLRALTWEHFDHMRTRVTEASFALPQMDFPERKHDGSQPQASACSQPQASACCSCEMF